LFCGEPERAEIFEVWGHEFMLQTCCQGPRGVTLRLFWLEYLGG
jgi:hypothetical protein